MPPAPVLICHADAIVELRRFADLTFSQLLRPLVPSVLEALWSHDVFARVVLLHVSWLFTGLQSKADLCALSPTSFRESALGVQSSAPEQFELSRLLLNDMRCQALDQLAGSLCCIYRKVPLVSKVVGAAVSSYVNMESQHSDMVLKLRVGCNVFLPLWWRSQCVELVAFWHKAQLKSTSLML